MINEFSHKNELDSANVMNTQEQKFLNQIADNIESDLFQKTHLEFGNQTNDESEWNTMSFDQRNIVHIINNHVDLELEWDASYDFVPQMTPWKDDVEFVPSCSKCCCAKDSTNHGHQVFSVFDTSPTSFTFNRDVTNHENLDQTSTLAKCDTTIFQPRSTVMTVLVIWMVLVMMSLILQCGIQQCNMYRHHELLTVPFGFTYNRGLFRLSTDAIKHARESPQAELVGHRVAVKQSLSSYRNYLKISMLYTEVICMLLLPYRRSLCQFRGASTIAVDARFHSSYSPKSAKQHTWLQFSSPAKHHDALRPPPQPPPFSALRFHDDQPRFTEVDCILSLQMNRREGVDLVVRILNRINENFQQLLIQSIDVLLPTRRTPPRCLGAMRDSPCICNH